MSALLVTATMTREHENPKAIGHIVVDSNTISAVAVVNLDLGQAIPQDDDDEGSRWVSLYPAEARALAAALRHYAREVER